MPQVVLVIGVGRSGSTLMQRVLNSMPSTNICGENHNAWLHMVRFAEAWLRLQPSSRQAYELLERDQQHFQLAWYNVEGVEALLPALRQLFLTMYQGDRWQRIGFKEIRIGQRDYAQLQAQLDFFHLLFPDCRIIFNLRQPQAILRSQAEQRNPADFGDPAAQALFQRYARTNDALLWHYEDWHQPHRVKQLYAYVGEPFTQGYQAVLANPTR